jgi:hypothetical protein
MSPNKIAATPMLTTASRAGCGAPSTWIPISSASHRLGLVGVPSSLARRIIGFISRRRPGVAWNCAGSSAFSGFGIEPTSFRLLTAKNQRQLASCANAAKIEAATSEEP